MRILKLDYNLFELNDQVYSRDSLPDALMRKGISLNTSKAVIEYFKFYTSNIIEIDSKERLTLKLIKERK